MTIGEFKAWFEGYTESCGFIHELDEERIKEQLKKVVEFTITYPTPVPISIPSNWPAPDGTFTWPEITQTWIDTSPNQFIVYNADGTVKPD